MTLQERYNILYKALRAIADLEEGNCERYVAKADSLAIDAIVTVDCDAGEEPSAPNCA